MLIAGELKYLARAMVLTLGAVCSYLFLFGDRASLLGIWWTLVIFFAARCSQSSFRLLQIYPRFDTQLVAKHS
ncbi:hypothetical protein CYMTET_54796 [Cymbomonas tetramitiformis]|uniref:Uncharacterized protein n=1 Tax=Cymbomonas tetramitiformis TaxID=36881 RepID=A0AAE0BFE4_9CHLO|nr:hypothetical protein CYMTET_54796 [Cymbomonas tetramitiformis]